MSLVSSTQARGLKCSLGGHAEMTRVVCHIVFALWMGSIFNAHSPFQHKVELDLSALGLGAVKRRPVSTAAGHPLYCLHFDEPTYGLITTNFRSAQKQVC